MEDSDLKKNEIDEIVLVDGSTRIPKIQQLVKEFFNGKEPNRGIMVESTPTKPWHTVQLSKPVF